MNVGGERLVVKRGLGVSEFIRSKGDFGSRLQGGARCGVKANEGDR